MTLHVIIACHNRRETTLGSLASLFAASKTAHVGTTATLFDDGSTDDSATAVLAAFPSVEIIDGDGSTYWAKSMSEAERVVLDRRSPASGAQGDYILWLNDDVVLDEDSLKRVLPTARAHPEAVIVCAVRDPETQATTYSGFRRRGVHPLQLDLVEPRSIIQSVDTFNGNVVLVPIDIARQLGSIDGSYAHALADIDYGYRAKQAGISSYLAPGTYGTCARNPPASHGSLLKSWRAFVGVKGGGHPSSLLRILRVGAPRSWPAFLAGTYVIWWFRALRRQMFRP